MGADQDERRTEIVKKYCRHRIALISSTSLGYGLLVAYVVVAFLLRNRNGQWQLAASAVRVSVTGSKVNHFGGNADYIPVTGRWDGTGKNQSRCLPGFAGEWLVDYNGNGMLDSGDRTCRFGGEPGAVPVTGDSNGSGSTKIGIYRPSTGEWLLDFDGDGILDAIPDRKYKFGGDVGDMPVTGDWNGCGMSRIGIVRPSLAIASYLWVLNIAGNGKMDDARG